MTITTYNPRVVVPHGSLVNPIEVDVQVLVSSHVKVYADNTLLNVGTHYTLSGVGDPDGFAVNLINPSTIAPARWTVFVDPPIEQGSDLSVGGNFGNLYEDALDAMTRQMQALRDRLDRSVSLPISDSGTPVNIERGADSAALMWSGSDIKTGPSIAAILAVEVNAAASAAQSQTYANNAGASSASAQTASTNALASLASIRQRDLGAFADAATADAYAASNGITKIAGTTYFNTTDDVEYRWTGGVWIGVQSTPVIDDPAMASNSATSPPSQASVSTFVRTKTPMIAIDRAAVKAFDTTKVKSVLLYESGREGQFIWKTGDFSAQIAADTREGIYLKSDAVAASSGAWVRQHNNEFFAKWFGAKEDGVTLDDAAVQAAANVCLLSLRPVPLILTGPCMITVSINIDRQVGTPAGANTFFIRGRGPFAGFVSNLTGSIISTTLAWLAPFNNTPACNLTFQNITWLGQGNINTLCVSPKFLKVSFESCRFNSIRATQSPYYLQSWYFVRCSVIAWPGLFVQTADEMYDLRVHNCDFESGGSGFKSFNSGVYGGSIIGNLFQGSGQFFSQGKGEGLSIIGNYLEKNSLPDFQLSDPVNVGAHHGTVFMGNFMAQAPHTGYCVVVGDAKGFVAGGNSCLNANMYNTANTVRGSFKSIGDSVTGLVSGVAAQKFSVLGQFDGDGAGNFKTASLPSGSAGALVSGNASNLTSITLDAGEYIVSGVAIFRPAATTSVTAYTVSISTASATLGSSDRRSSNTFAAFVSGGADINMATPMIGLSLAAPTTVYLVVSSSFTVSTMAAFGTINVHRLGGQ